MTATLDKLRKLYAVYRDHEYTIGSFQRDYADDIRDLKSTIESDISLSIVEALDHELFPSVVEKKMIFSNQSKIRKIAELKHDMDLMKKVKPSIERISWLPITAVTNAYPLSYQYLEETGRDQMVILLIFNQGGWNCEFECENPRECIAFMEAKRLRNFIIKLGFFNDIQMFTREQPECPLPEHQQLCLSKLTIGEIGSGKLLKRARKQSAWDEHLLRMLLHYSR